MNRFFTFTISSLLFFTFTAVVPAETMYIRTVVKITLRTGPGTDHKIIALITSGDPIDVLETNGEWSKVRTLDGKEGWIMSNLITAEKPKQYIPISPVSDNMPLKEQASLIEENKALKAENMKLETALSQREKEQEQLRARLKAAETTSTEFEKEISELKAQAEETKKKKVPVMDSDFKQNVWWFLIGAGIILLGFIVGYNVRRPRPRSLLR
jgi:SH3 domain protein